MKYQGCIPLLLLSSVLCLAQFNDDTRRSELDGTIIGLQPDTFCSVQLFNLQESMIPENAPCMDDGTFHFTNIQRGSYRLEARIGTEEYSQQISVLSPHEQFEIRLPEAVSSPDQQTVSVNELGVPGKARNELQKARELISQGDLDKANEHLEKALDIAPTFASAVTTQAVVMLGQNRYDSALTAADRAVSLDPMLPMAQFVRASALNVLGRPREAQLAAEHGLRIVPSSWQGHYELAKALLAQGQSEAALAEVNQAVKDTPNVLSEMYFVQATALFNLRKLDAAQASLDQYKKMNPGDQRSAKLQSLLDQHH
jgi:tetratricopeptide (TPR) repeat protein